MKLRPELFARALVDLSQELPEKELPALVDAVFSYLHEHRASRVIRMLPRLVREAWGKRGKTIPVSVATPSGDLGTSQQTLITALERMAGKKVELMEKGDATLLGGATAMFQDERIDASLSGALERLSTELLMPIS